MGNEWTETEMPAPTECRKKERTGTREERRENENTQERLVPFACYFDSGPAVVCMIFTGLCDGPVTASKGVAPPSGLFG